jgi:hypothetical protein
LEVWRAVRISNPPSTRASQRAPAIQSALDTSSIKRILSAEDIEKLCAAKRVLVSGSNETAQVDVCIRRTSLNRPALR